MTNAAHASHWLEDLAGTDLLDESNVGLEKVVSGKLSAFHPTHIVKDTVLDFSLEVIDAVEVQFHRVPGAIAMSDHRHSRANRRFDAELFLQLPPQRRPESFLGLNLAAGELPLERHGLLRCALADQDL